MYIKYLQFWNTNEHENYVSGECIHEMFVARALCTIFVAMSLDRRLKYRSNSVFFCTIAAGSILTAYYELFAYTYTGLHNLT